VPIARLRRPLLIDSAPEGAWRARRELALTLADAALAAIEPRAATQCALATLPSELDAALRGCRVLAFGKAARAMTEAACDALHPSSGLVLTHTDGDDAALRPLVVRGAAHPLPSADALSHAEEALTLMRSAREGEVVLCLVSGGGSSMLERPIDGVSLEDLLRLTRTLLRAGATIDELNAVRTALSTLKGGRLLAEARAGVHVVTLVIADVPGGALSTVASGPTVPPAAQALDASLVLRHLGLTSQLDARLLDAIAHGAARDRPAIHAEVHTRVAADDVTARDALVAEGRARGLRLGVLPRLLVGEARDEGPRFVAEARALAGRESLDGVVATGETTVTVRGSGRGGRNQELALGALVEVAAWGELLLSLATDGEDGTSGAAGALVDPLVGAEHSLGTRERFARAALVSNDSARFCAAHRCALETGPTGTNVADLALWLR
jgi:glycerate-2-kinase